MHTPASPSFIHHRLIQRNMLLIVQLTTGDLMIVTFKTKPYADITMFGDVAIHLLKLMGHSGTVPGAIVADDVSAYLQRLEQAVTEAKARDGQDDDSDDEENSHIPITKRALPLIELLQAAVNANADVMWE
jgi:hypothetical protein